MKHTYLLAHFFSKLVPANILGHITPIFMLHRLTGTDPTHVERYLNHLIWCFKYIHANHYTPISLEQLVAARLNGVPPPKKSVVFTIDDGFWDHYEIAAPLFEKHGIPLTCFVITSFLDQKIWPWDDQIRYILSNTEMKTFDVILPNDKQISIDSIKGVGKNTYQLQLQLKMCPQENLYSWLEHFYKRAEVDIPNKIPEEYRPMSWENAQKFIDMGHAIAPHTCSHRILSQLKSETAKFEIEESWNQVSSKLRGATKIFAYPTGRPVDFGEREENILFLSQFKGAVSTVPKHTTKEDNIFNLPRFSLPNDKLNFIQYLSSIEELKSYIRKS